MNHESTSNSDKILLMAAFVKQVREHDDLRSELRLTERRFLHVKEQLDQRVATLEGEKRSLQQEVENVVREKEESIGRHAHGTMLVDRIASLECENSSLRQLLEAKNLSLRDPHWSAGMAGCARVALLRGGPIQWHVVQLSERSLREEQAELGEGDFATYLTDNFGSSERKYVGEECISRFQGSFPWKQIHWAVYQVPPSIHGLHTTLSMFLSHISAKRNLLTLRCILNLLLSVVTCVDEHFHRNGRCHGNLNLDTILLCPLDAADECGNFHVDVIVSGFGVAQQQVSSLSPTRLRMATQETIGEKSFFDFLKFSGDDVWSFGVLAWQVATYNEIAPYDTADVSVLQLNDFFQRGGVLCRPPGLSSLLYDVLIFPCFLPVHERPSICDVVNAIKSLL